MNFCSIIAISNHCVIPRFGKYIHIVLFNLHNSIGRQVRYYC